jgi:hypothetical protein
MRAASRYTNRNSTTRAVRMIMAYTFSAPRINAKSTAMVAMASSNSSGSHNQRFTISPRKRAESPV